MKEFSRPSIKSHSHLIKKHFVDYYYPVVYSHKKKRSVYLADGRGIVRFKDQTKAMEYALNFVARKR